MTVSSGLGASLSHLRAAKDLMDREYADDLDLNELARRAGYSRFHFVRAFRATYGETPRAYLTRRRVERAKDLLRAANLSVTEVCFLVGFSTLGSFSTRFAKLVGVSPGEYRRQAVRRHGPPAIPGCYVMMWTRPYASQDTEQSRRSTVAERASSLEQIG